ncbi:MAG TPA: caspase family protein, partial [Candidatus Eisenbacteria bacterium]|nr:caspase family protein [Candidatus Eisenbacteria bacterium]
MVSRVGAALVLVLLWGLSTSADQPKGTSRALLIGIQTYAQFGDGWWDLDGPANDIALVRGILVDRLGFLPENITVLQDRAATRTAIASAFARLTKESRKG